MGKKRVVPWYSMNEWLSVYQLLYSQNVEQQKIALDRMISWKARCSHLPLGVECSLGIAQVLCEDPEHLHQTLVSIPREQQLRLVYTSGVMRFLNLMLDINREQNPGTMYMKAAQNNIPDWIVNLRHDAAHGVSLPDLSLLRTAAVFIFKWLDEHYWEKEMQLVSDWHVTEADVLELPAKERELQDIMETWEALSLYSLAGFHQLRLIPDNELMARIASIHQMLSEEDDTGEPGMQLEINYAKVSTALKLVLRRIVRYFKNSSVGKATYLSRILVDGDLFLPSSSLMKILYPSGYDSESPLHQLPPALSNSCEDLVSTLWNLGAVPDLVSKLISVICDLKESDLRQNMAALWVQKILLSCIKGREAGKVFSSIQDNLDNSDVVRHYKELFPESTKRSILLSLAFSAVENQRPDLKKGYNWNTLMEVPTSLTSLDLVKQCFLHQSKFISMFLPSLMEITAPSIPLQLRRNLLGLLEAFNSNETDMEEISDSQTFSVDDLPSECSLDTEENSSENPSGCTKTEKKSRWTLRQDNLDWNKCPLGVVPWQREQHHLDQEACDGRQEQRTWPTLFVPGEWMNVATDIPESSPGAHMPQSDVLNRIKDGRVKKPYLKQTPSKLFTPIKALKMKRYSLSPREKAINVLTSL